MARTDEQRSIVDAIISKKDNEKVIIVNAFSGCGKTHVVLDAVNDRRAWFDTGYMLAYNAKIAKENATKTPYWLDSRTIHSLGYRYIVSPDKLTIKSNVDLKDFNLKKNSDKHFALSIFNEFCSSKYIKISDFIKNVTKKKHKNFKNVKKYEDAVKHVFIDMQNGKTLISHNAYIKLFHLKLFYEPQNINNIDILIIDEFGDANEVMVEIFKLYPAKKKVAIGDKWQNIYTFNHTINGLKAIKDSMQDTVSLELTKSFRCSSMIAKAVNSFCINHIDEKMRFSGTNNKEEYTSFSYITRNNSALLKEIEKCMLERTKFSLTRNVNSIFALIFMIKFNAKKEYNYFLKNKKYSPTYKIEFNYVMEEYNNMMKNEYTFDFASWIIKRDNDGELINENLVGTAKTASGYNSSQLLKMYNYAKDSKNHDKAYIITTAFSFKGGESDIVYIDDSLNKSVYKENANRAKNIVDKKELTNDNIAEMLLYYVACTRAKHTLINANALDEQPSKKYSEKNIQLFGDVKTYYGGMVQGSLQSYDDFKALVKSKQNKLNIL